MYRIIRKDTNENVTNKTVLTGDGNILLKFKNGMYILANKEEYIVKEYVLPSKKVFCNLFICMKDIDDRHDKLNKVLAEECIDGILSFPTMVYEMLNLLTSIFDDESRWIEYFAYDLEYGRLWKSGCVTESGADCKLETPEDLYDMLIRNIEEK